MRNHQSGKTVLWSWDYRDDDAPRPVEVARLEELLNTVDHHRFGAHADKPAELRDQLAGAEPVKGWLVDHDLAEIEQPLSEDDAAAVRQFRDDLRAYLEHRDHAGSPPRAWPPPSLRLRVLPEPDRGGVELTSASDGVNAALERLAADAVIAHIRGTFQRLKICAAGDCRFAYYDHSRSRTSRWCSMRTCGNRVKTRQYRRRQR